jgi:site-specific recombinase XerD
MKKEIDGHRKKSDEFYTIPLLPKAEEILNKYNNNPRFIYRDNALLPYLSNQKMNSYLKEIADPCEIHKNLTFHLARHTFATTVTLTNGVPLETVSKC